VSSAPTTTGTADQIAAFETDLANFRGERSPDNDVTFVVVKFVGSSI